MSNKAYELKNKYDKLMHLLTWKQFLRAQKCPSPRYIDKAEFTKSVSKSKTIHAIADEVIRLGLELDSLRKA